MSKKSCNFAGYLIIMKFLYWLIGLAGALGHRKAKLLYRGQKGALKALSEAMQTARLKDSNPIWIHVASVGEFEQARPIIERLREAKPDQRIILTFFSPSGYELRKNYDKVDFVGYLPCPTRSNAKKMMSIIKPSMALFVKYEFWPAYLRRLKKNKIPTYSISAIFRPGQRFFKPWGKGQLALLKCFKHIYVQDEVSRDLLLKHGLKDVTIAGDTRFDRVSQIAAQAKTLPIVAHFVEPRSNEDGMPINYRVIIAGSTWPADELFLTRYLQEHDDVLLVMAPHEIHEGHLHRIMHIFKGRYVRFTEANSDNIKHVCLLVIDTIGMLSSIYRYGQVAYIGGGFGAGIHNTLEAAVYGMPVLFGPNHTHFREALGLLKSGGAFTFHNYDEFAAQMDKALAEYEQLGKLAGDFVKTGTGATKLICSELFNI